MNDDGTLAHSRSNALHIASPRIAHSKYAGQTAFQHLWNAFERPARVLGRPIASVQITPCQDETLIVQRKTALQPLGSWRCPGHDENVLDAVPRDFTRLFVSPCHTLQVLAAFQRNDLGIEMQLDLWILYQALYQV